MSMIREPEVTEVKWGDGFKDRIKKAGNTLAKLRKKDKTAAKNPTKKPPGSWNTLKKAVSGAASASSRAASEILRSMTKKNPKKPPNKPSKTQLRL